MKFSNLADIDSTNCGFLKDFGVLKLDCDSCNAVNQMAVDSDSLAIGTCLFLVDLNSLGNVSTTDYTYII